jgi:hypothetical protein
VLGEAAVAASKTDTFLGERYRRIARRRGAKRAIVAVGRSILVIVWHLLSDPTVRFQDLGAGFYDTRINAERVKRNHIRQLEALGYKVTLRTRRLSRRATSRLDPAPLRCAGCCRLPTNRDFRIRMRPEVQVLPGPPAHSDQQECWLSRPPPQRARWIPDQDLLPGYRSLS